MLQLFLALFLVLSLHLGASQSLLRCQSHHSGCYSLEWEDSPHEQASAYYVFAADNWKQLMPLEAPNEFLQSGKAFELLACSTCEPKLDLQTSCSYARIIGITDQGRYFDVAPLIEFAKSSISAEIPPQGLAAKGHGKKALDLEALEEVAPYLLPKDHFTLAALNKIFSVKGVLSSTKSMEEAGFKILMFRQGRGLVIASHPSLKNYLIKTYLDSASHVDWTRWVRRIKGRDRIQNFLDENPYYNRFFKVPKKWIYHIPKKGRGVPQEEGIPRQFLLVVENMDLVDSKETERLYKKVVTKSFLEGLYLIIEKTGFSDGHIGNLPFSSDRRIAFIDTEYTNSWPVHHDWLTKWFTPHRQLYWQYLIDNHGP